jgi:hypothetical protein
MSIGTNIFPILNANELISRYTMHRIRGLNNAPNEYYANCQHIIRKLSYSLKSPITIIHDQNNPFLITPEGVQPPNTLSLIGTSVRFEKDKTVDLDYTNYSPQNVIICQRFLDFAAQGLLFDQTKLWQPTAGKPFYLKEGKLLKGNLTFFRGYALRATLTPNNQWGFCVDMTSKIVACNPLPYQISQNQFEQWKNRTVVYHYGHQWYEIKLTAISDLNASEYIIPDTDKNLLEWAVEHCRKPIPQELANVPHDATVGIYLDNQEKAHGALLSLCYPVIRTNDKDASEHHNASIMAPKIRRHEAIKFIEQYLKIVPFPNTSIKLSTEPLEIESKIFNVPDTLFGNNHILSVRGTAGTQNTSLDALGKERMALLRNKAVGFYVHSPLDRHYLILPQTVADSYGKRFIQDLKQKFNEFYPHPYEPELVTYNDRVALTYPKQGNAILNAVRSKCTMPGYALVMIHNTTDRQGRDEDQLAAMIMRELRKNGLDIKATVIHTAVGRECYQEVRNNNQLNYESNPSKKGKLGGYLRMVVINKILLNNEKWPFVLGTSLHADLTIGMDIKGHTAGFVVVGSKGSEINTLFKTSRQKEKLTKEQMKAYLVAIIRDEVQIRRHPIQNIVLQRDGRLFDMERDGAHEAIAYLKKESLLPRTAAITFIQISKSAPVRLRLFDVSEQNEILSIENPQVGTYCILNESNGYLCSTGRAFAKSGTVRPLHIQHLEGPLSLEQCLEDVFYLTCLPWTRPDDAIRNPITIKLMDRFLAEEATEYDDDALDIDAILDEEEFDEEEVL